MSPRAPDARRDRRIPAGERRFANRHAGCLYAEFMAACCHGRPDDGCREP
jgi:hypothetical protein